MRWLDGITDLMDTNLGRLREILRDRKAWHPIVHVVTKGRMRLSHGARPITIQSINKEPATLPFKCLLRGQQLESWQPQHQPKGSLNLASEPQELSNEQAAFCCLVPSGMGALEYRCPLLSVWDLSPFWVWYPKTICRLRGKLKPTQSSRVQLS